MYDTASHRLPDNFAPPHIYIPIQTINAIQLERDMDLDILVTYRTDPGRIKFVDPLPPGEPAVPSYPLAWRRHFVCNTAAGRYPEGADGKDEQDSDKSNKAKDNGEENDGEGTTGWDYSAINPPVPSIYREREDDVTVCYSSHLSPEETQRWLEAGRLDTFPRPRPAGDQPRWPAERYSMPPHLDMVNLRLNKLIMDQKKKEEEEEEEVREFWRRMEAEKRHM